MRFFHCDFEEGALSEINHIKALKKIELFQCTFLNDERPIEILSHNKHIQEITLGLIYSDQPTDVSPLKLCSNLKSLSLVNCSHVSGLNSLANIQHLRINSFGMKSLDTDSFDHLENLQDLELENLTFNGIFPYLRNLQKLSLSNVKIKHPTFFQQLKSQLQNLSLKNTKIPEEAILQILQKNQDSLKHLEISPIESQNIINSISKCRSLQSINAGIMLKSSNISFKDLSNLESISLSMDTLSLQTISDISYLPKLCILDLSRCNINEEDVFMLKKSLSIQELNIGSNQINYNTIRFLPFRYVRSGTCGDPFQPFFPSRCACPTTVPSSENVVPNTQTDEN